MVADTPDAGYLACCQAVEAWDHRDRLGAITAPTLVIGGAHDPSTPGRAARPHHRRRHPGRPPGGARRGPPGHHRARRRGHRPDRHAQRGLTRRSAQRQVQHGRVPPGVVDATASMAVSPVRSSPQQRWLPSRARSHSISRQRRGRSGSTLRQMRGESGPDPAPSRGDAARTEMAPTRRGPPLSEPPVRPPPPPRPARSPRPHPRRADRRVRRGAPRPPALPAPRPGRRRAVLPDLGVRAVAGLRTAAARQPVLPDPLPRPRSCRWSSSATAPAPAARRRAGRARRPRRPRLAARRAWPCSSRLYPVLPFGRWATRAAGSTRSSTGRARSAVSTSSWAPC